MNPEKLKKLQAEVRIGGKGTQRRKKKVVHTTAASDDKKLQQSLKKLSLSPIPGIEEVNIIRNDGTIINIKNPKTQASVAINTFAITGNGMERTVQDMLPGILPQLSQKDLEQLYTKMQPTTGKKSKNEGGGGDKQEKSNQGKEKVSQDDNNATGQCDDNVVVDDEDEDVPDLVADFEAVAMNEAAAVKDTKLDDAKATE